MDRESHSEEAERLAGLGWYVWDAATGDVRANDVMFGIWGIERQDLSGPKFAELMRLVHPDDVSLLEAAGDALLASASAVTTEYRLLRADGTTKPVRRRARLERDAKGAPVRIVATVQEIARDYETVVSRRMITSLLDDLLEGTLTPEQLREEGRRLARAAKLRETDGLLRAFASLGMGTLELVETSGERWIFRSVDLHGSGMHGRVTSCHLALGYVEGLVKAASAAESLGAETHCRRRGDARCEFMVRARRGQ